MSKNLEIIQKVSQVAKVVCRVMFVCSIVGAAISLVSAILAAALPEAKEWFSIGDVKFYGIGVVNNGETDIKQVTLMLIAVAVTLIPSAILMKFAENYFEQELKDGTPFTFEGAEYIKKLGIMTIVMPMAAEIIVKTMAMIAAGANESEITSGGSIITGLMLFFLSFVFKYGAEISSQKTSAAPVPASDKKDN